MFKFIEEYRKLNYYGEIFGVSRKFFETNHTYRKRLVDYFKKSTESTSHFGTLKALTDVLELFGFKTYDIEKDFENSQIKLTLSVF